MAEYMEYDWRVHSLSNKRNESIINYKTEPTDKSQAIISLKNLINNCADLEFRNNIPQNDEFMLKFLYARKFNYLKSFELLNNYFNYRKNNNEIFMDLIPTANDVQKALQDGLPGVLSSRDRRGRCVLTMSASNWDCSYSLITIYRSLLLSLDYLIKDKQNQCNGFVIIVDWTGITFKQSTNLTPKYLKLIIDGLQDCYPARFKGIHFINQPWYVEAALLVIKKFLRDDIKERIYVHGNNLSTLFDYLPTDILPTELGGEMPSYNPKIWIDKLNMEYNL